MRTSMDSSAAADAPLGRGPVGRVDEPVRTTGAPSDWPSGLCPYRPISLFPSPFSPSTRVHPSGLPSGTRTARCRHMLPPCRSLLGCAPAPAASRGQYRSQRRRALRSLGLWLSLRRPLPSLGWQDPTYYNGSRAKFPSSELARELTKGKATSLTAPVTR